MAKLKRGNRCALLLAFLANLVIAGMGVGILVAGIRALELTNDIAQYNMSVITPGYVYIVGGTVIGVGVFGILLALWLYKNPYAGCAKCLITIHVLAAFIFFALFAVVGIASFLVNGYLKDHASVLDEVIQSTGQYCCDSPTEDAQQKCEDYLTAEYYGEFCTDYNNGNIAAHTDRFVDKLTAPLKVLGGIAIGVAVVLLLGIFSEFVLCCGCCGKKRKEEPKGIEMTDPVTGPQGTANVYV